MLLSTCNRVELYAGGADAAPRPGQRRPARRHAQLPRRPARARRRARSLTLAQRDAVAHLYRVAASLDSMVVGEPQILAQVKQAYQRAADSAPPAR